MNSSAQTTPTAFTVKTILKYKPFRTLWLAQFVSIFGDFVALFAVISLITFRWHGTPLQVTNATLRLFFPCKGRRHDPIFHGQPAILKAVKLGNSMTPQVTRYFRDFPFSNLAVRILFMLSPVLRESMARRITGKLRRKTVYFTPIRRHARPRWIGSTLFVALLALFSFVPNNSSFAQASARKVKSRVEPVYPELAKRNNISGSARVELVVTPDGRVKDVKVLGGNPVLVQAVVAAVVKWKYEPAAEESTVVIKFDFAGP